MPLGVGLAPAGSSSAGYGVPDKSTAPNNASLPDTATGLSQPGRLLDPVTKSYRFTADGRLVGFGSVPQRVQLALSTLKGSSASRRLGQELWRIQDKGPNFVQQITSAVNNALSDLIRAGEVQVIGITVQEPPSNPDAGMILVQWRDLTTSIQHLTPIGQ